MPDAKAPMLDFYDLRSEGVGRAAGLAGNRLDQQALRAALGGFVTGVTVVTTRWNGKPVGVTVNSFTSVSLDPPLLLFCLGRASSNAAAFADAKRFAINVLHAGQREIAETKGEGRFALLQDAGEPSGPPIVAGALAAFECDRHDVHEGGDHLIYVGRVRRAWCEPTREALAFFRGGYCRLDPERQVAIGAASPERPGS